MEEGNTCMGPLGSLTCACSSSSTRLRSMCSSRRSCKAVVTESTYSSTAPNRHEISNHKPIGNGGVCQMKNDSCVAEANVEKFSTTSTASVPPTSTISKSAT